MAPWPINRVMRAYAYAWRPHANGAAHGGQIGPTSVNLFHFLCSTSAPASCCQLRESNPYPLCCSFFHRLQASLCVLVSPPSFVHVTFGFQHELYCELLWDFYKCGCAQCTWFFAIPGLCCVCMCLILQASNWNNGKCSWTAQEVHHGCGWYWRHQM